MPKLFISQEAEDDLELIYGDNEVIATRILALLQELQNDADLLDRLTQHEYGLAGYADFNVSKWLEQWNQGRDLWRLKLWDLEEKFPDNKYRIIYAFIPLKQQYHVIGIVPREFNYEANHPIAKRIIEAYKLLCDW